jgi:hypothetical protein
MRKPTSCILLLALLVAGSLAAGEPANFSGEWIFNEAKSVLDENGAQFLPLRMTLIQAGNDMTVQKFFNNEFQGDFVDEEKMTLDGKEGKSEFWNSPRTSTATWSAKCDTLTITTKIVFEREGEKSEMNLKEAYCLKDDGKTLSVQHFSSSTWGERKITMVFERKEAQKDANKR